MYASRDAKALRASASFEIATELNSAAFGCGTGSKIWEGEKCMKIVNFMLFYHLPWFLSSSPGILLSFLLVFVSCMSCYVLNVVLFVNYLFVLCVCFDPLNVRLATKFSVLNLFWSFYHIVNSKTKPVGGGMFQCEFLLQVHCLNRS
jgi:hypothetical protein